MTTKSGLLLVNKAKGITSFGLVRILRKITNVKKIGHAGTLDPIATGVMIMLIGQEYTKKSSQFVQMEKVYLATLFLGKSTDTFDEEGKILATSNIIPTLTDVQKALVNFQGEIEQIPPMYSAKKVNGQKLYQMARKGLTIERKPIQVQLKIDFISYNYPYLKIRVHCSKGTYIRTLANDLGEQLKSKAYLFALTRESIGSYHLKDCIAQNDLPFSMYDYLRTS